jgi:hypothetical protein
MVMALTIKVERQRPDLALAGGFDAGGVVELDITGAGKWLKGADVNE